VFQGREGEGQHNTSAKDDERGRGKGLVEESGGYAVEEGENVRGGGGEPVYGRNEIGRRGQGGIEGGPSSSKTRVLERKGSAERNSRGRAQIALRESP